MASNLSLGMGNLLMAEEGESDLGTALTMMFVRMFTFPGNTMGLADVGLQFVRESELADYLAAHPRDFASESYVQDGILHMIVVSCSGASQEVESQLRKHFEREITT